MNKPTPWTIWFLDFCRTAAQRSKDPETRVGAVIVRDRHIIATGYNGFPAGVTETDERWARPLKYSYVIHAEENAILQAARLGVAVKGATMYSLLKPCKHCALLIAGAGIRELVYDKRNTEAYLLERADLTTGNDRSPHGFDIGDTILEEAGVFVTAFDIATNKGEPQ